MYKFITVPWETELGVDGQLQLNVMKCDRWSVLSPESNQWCPLKGLPQILLCQKTAAIQRSSCGKKKSQKTHLRLCCLTSHTNTLHHFATYNNHCVKASFILTKPDCWERNEYADSHQGREQWLWWNCLALYAAPSAEGEEPAIVLCIPRPAVP